MLIGVLLLSAPMAWVSHQRSRWAQEQAAVAYLHLRNDATTIFVRNADGIIEFVDAGPRWELSEIWNGRLFNPIASVSLYDITVDKELVSHLEMLPRLKRLILRNCRFDIVDTWDLSQFQQIKELDLTDCRLPLKRIVPQVHKLKSLENLGLGNTGISDEHLTHLEQLKSLRQLRLYGNDITDRGLLHVGKLSSLERLNISSTQCSSRGIQYLEPLKNLWWLDLSETNIDDIGVQAICEQFPDLYLLNIANTKVSDAGMIYISSLSELDTLFLRNTAVSDTGVRQLKHLGRLFFLDLTGTQITDSSISTLLKLPMLTNNSVLLRKTKMSDEALKIFRNEISRRSVTQIQRRRSFIW